MDDTPGLSVDTVQVQAHEAPDINFTTQIYTLYSTYPTRGTHGNFVYERYRSVTHSEGQQRLKS